ncbi:CoA-binding protein [Roseitranquillus sediminis]|uniref:CoA-binding protein n=1 Tax=Roseitranquillus sediminis TaxID=2809051 RepID=UPI001D0C33D1|nr:CoA-binding protein [Roseitranquillus sediminis]MBM9594563.1 CoA-binding protein [Roseitranquillus sediminis]
MSSDDELRDIFRRTRTIACVGLSPNPARPSHYVSAYLAGAGYRVVGVNPGQAGRQLLGQTVVATVGDAPDDTDMLDIFRRPGHVLPLVREAIDALPGLRTIWMQVGIRNDEAADLARSRGIAVVQDRCAMVDHRRLMA